MQLLPVAMRGSFGFGHEGDQFSNPYQLDASEPRQFVIECPSPDYTNLSKEGTLSMEFEFEKSLDGINWEGFAKTTGGSNVIGKGGVIHPPQIRIGWNGIACYVRGSITVNTSFRYGVNLT